MKNTALVVAGIIFSLVALMHLLRLIYHWGVTIAGQNVPPSVSIAGLIVGAVLALWMFISAGKS